MEDARVEEGQRKKSFNYIRQAS